MRNARYIIKCFIADNQIEVQHLKRFNRFRWRCSLNQTMQLWNRTRIALNDFWSIFFSHFNFFNFLSWLIISDRQCFNRKCQFQKIVFVKIYLWDWTALTNFSTNRYFKKNKLCFFFNVTNLYVDWFNHQCLFVHVSYKVLVFKMNYEHQDNVHKWHINDVVEEHSSILFVDAINDEHDFISFDHHRIVWFIDQFMRERNFIYESI
jgi:hypothetical protein